ncbi:MAG TPA: hypothetical protein VGR06_18455 [Actinophytocola sp.]|uniref:hypothetical protein n=1 Tax=Actinophytocola sp. TaxID=1872138 RepID=UPI002E03EE92|nr:hypothetical protein [Actinophytocola sp.]
MSDEKLIIDASLPRWDVEIAEHRLVHAAPDRTWRAARDLDLLTVHTPKCGERRFHHAQREERRIHRTRRCRTTGCRLLIGGTLGTTSATAYRPLD